MCTVHRNRTLLDGTSEMCTVHRNRTLLDGTSEMCTVHRNRTHSTHKVVFTENVIK